jgi:hypothetical protein
MVKIVRLLFIPLFLPLFTIVGLHGVYASGDNPSNPQKVPVYRED